MIQGWTVCFLINSIITVYIHTPYPVFWDFPGGASGKELTCQCRRPERHRFDPRVGQIPWRRAWQPTLVFLPGESHGQRSWWATVCCYEVTSVVSDSVRPHRKQPTRLRRPWDSPGKNTGEGCHFLLQCVKVKSESEVAQSCPFLETAWTAAHQAPPSMGFSRREYWSGVPLPSLGLQYTWSQKVGHD